MTAKCIWCQKELAERGKLKDGLQESICLECLDEALMMAGAEARKKARPDTRRPATRPRAKAQHS